MRFCFNIFHGHYHRLAILAFLGTFRDNGRVSNVPMVSTGQGLAIRITDGLVNLDPLCLCGEDPVLAAVCRSEPNVWRLRSRVRPSTTTPPPDNHHWLSASMKRSKVPDAHTHPRRKIQQSVTTAPTHYTHTSCSANPNQSYLEIWISGFYITTSCL